jgi:hypothetical protein
VSYADYEHCPGCDGKALYMGERESPEGIVVWHEKCLEGHIAAGRGGPMTTVKWRPFDSADKAGTAPARGELVWIAPAADYGIPVTVGHFDGFTFRDKDGYDDLRVTHWAPIAWADPPQDGTQP